MISIRFYVNACITSLALAQSLYEKSSHFVFQLRQGSRLRLFRRPLRRPPCRLVCSVVFSVVRSVVRSVIHPSAPYLNRLGELSCHHQSTLPCLCSRLVKLHCLGELSRHRQSKLPCLCSRLVIRVPCSHPRRSHCHPRASTYI